MTKENQIKDVVNITRNLNILLGRNIQLQNINTFLKSNDKTFEDFEKFLMEEIKDIGYGIDEILKEVKKEIN